MIKLEEIGKVYGKKNIKTEALKNITLEIPDGSMIAIMGPSGSGKSTLLNIIGGMDKPSCGRYIFNGENIDRFSMEELSRFRCDNISFVFQHFSLLKYYTVFENIELPLYLKGIKKKLRNEMVCKILEDLDITDLRNIKPNALSGGQQQRVALGRAIVSDSKVILADEPTGSLDSENGNKIMELLKNINNQGRTIVVVTHDNMVAGYCDTLIKLKDGMIVSGCETVDGTVV